MKRKPTEPLAPEPPAPDPKAILAAALKAAADAERCAVFATLVRPDGRRFQIAVPEPNVAISLEDVAVAMGETLAKAARLAGLDPASPKIGPSLIEAFSAGLGIRTLAATREQIPAIAAALEGADAGESGVEIGAGVPMPKVARG